MEENCEEGKRRKVRREREARGEGERRRRTREGEGGDIRKDRGDK